MDFDYFHLLLFAIPFAVAYFFKVWFRRKSFLEYLIPSFIFFAIGFRALFSSFAQVFLADDIAAFLNQVPNPFIRELGYANMGMGIAAVIAVFYAAIRLLFFAALPYAIYLSLSALGHLSELIDIQSINYITFSDWVVVDFITPLTFFILFHLRSRYE